MSNRQLHNLTPISNSIDSADLFVVVDKSELTTHKVSLGELSDAIDGTTFLSSSYSSTSSFTTGTTMSSSRAEFVITSSYTRGLSGSSAYAWSSSYVWNSVHAHADSDLFEITSSDDTLNIYTIPNAGGSITIKPRPPFVNSYLIKPLSHADVIGSRVISSTSGIITYYGLPARHYEFEVSKLDANEKILRFSSILSYSITANVKYGEFRYFSSGGTQYTSGSGVTSISSSKSIISSFSELSDGVTSASFTSTAANASGNDVFSISASKSSESFFSDNTLISSISSNGPLPGMVLLYAGIRVIGSNAWYDCNGQSYSTSYTDLSASIGNKFTDGSIPNRLPKISSNFYSGSGPYNKQVYISQSILGHPTNTQISKSYGTGTIVGTYPEGTVYGTDMGPSGSAFYYNIKR